jgi:hypothetical protein
LLEPLQPLQDGQKDLPTSARGAELPQLSEADVMPPLVEVEQATKKAAAASDPPIPDRANATPPGLSRSVGVYLYLFVGFTLILLLGWSAQSMVRRLTSPSATSASHWSNGTRRSRGATAPRARSSQQANAENLLGRLATGDAAVVDQVLSQTDDWTGRTRRTPAANQSIMTTLNQHDLRARAAALQATLAMDGVSRDEAGLNRLEAAAATPNQRAWALWMLGALGNRGVEPDHIAKILETYLSDPDPNARAGATDGLGILATDETVPMLLDRFRSDPSPLVQERAACALAEAGMYTHEQRMVAAASMVVWLEDAPLGPQQKLWTEHALRDISGQDFGTDAAAWQRWYRESR